MQKFLIFSLATSIDLMISKADVDLRWGYVF